MRCEEAGPLLGDYRDHLLLPALREELERHVHQCEQCRADLATLDALAAQAQAWQEMPVPRWNRAAFAVQDRPARQWLPWLSLASSAMCVLLLVVGIDVQRDEAGFRVRFGGGSASPGVALDAEQLEQRLDMFRAQQQLMLRNQMIAWEIAREQQQRELMTTVLDYTREQQQRDLAQFAGYWTSVRDNDQALQMRAFNGLLTSQQQSRRELVAIKASLQSPDYLEAP